MCRALAEINRAGSLSIGSLGRAILSATSTTSEIATRLKKAVLIKKWRGPFGENVDGRVVTVELTDLGRKLCRQCRERVHQRSRSVVGRVPTEERTAIALALRQLNKLVGKGTE